MALWCPDAVLPCELRRVNQLGGLFVTGCPLPDAKRRKIVELALCGLRAADISHQLKAKEHPGLPPSLYMIQVSNGCVSKILTRYYKVGIVQPKTRGGSRPQITTPQLVAGIAQLKQERPSLFAREIRERLEAAGTCAASGIPSVSSINRILRRLEAPGGSPFLRKLPQPGSPLAGEGEKKVLAEAPTSTSSSRSAGAAGMPKTRSRTVFSREQLEALESAFQRSQYPEAATWAELAGQSGLPEATLRIWFSNRRARWRREATRAQHTGSGLTPATPGAASQGLCVNGSCPPGYQVCSLPAALRSQVGGHQPRRLPLLGIADPGGAALTPSNRWPWSLTSGPPDRPSFSGRHSGRCEEVRPKEREAASLSSAVAAERPAFFQQTEVPGFHRLPTGMKRAINWRRAPVEGRPARQPQPPGARLSSGSPSAAWNQPPPEHRTPADGTPPSPTLPEASAGPTPPSDLLA